jgi:hypothetical protein
MLENLLLAFCGGAFGAIVGALPAFILFGLVVMIGSLLVISGENETFQTFIAFGHIFAPHTAFVGGVAAAAYGAKNKINHMHGKDTRIPMLQKDDPYPILVGGMFGVVGFLLMMLIDVATSEPFLLTKLDAIAGAVFISTIIIRLCFSKMPVVAKHPSVLTESPKQKTTRIWMPWESNWYMVLLLGLIYGIISSYIAIVLQNPFFGFGFAVFSLIFLQLGNHMPVSHHIVLPAGIATLATGSILIGSVFGILGALLGELGARLFYNSGDTHIDPPAFSIFMTSFLLCFF